MQHTYICLDDYVVFGALTLIGLLVIVVICLLVDLHNRPRWLTEEQSHNAMDDALLDEPQIQGDGVKVPHSIQVAAQARYWKQAFIKLVDSRVKR